MLFRLELRDFIIIEELAVDFSQGMTIITGDSGAGKSLIIEAIDFCVGKRGANNVVRPSQNAAQITAYFDLTKLSGACAWLKAHDISLPDLDNCIIHRHISRDNRSRSYINNHPITLQLLREFALELINIHGQHECQRLLNVSTHREILDEYGDLLAQVQAVKTLYEEWRTHQRQLEKSLAQRTENGLQELLIFQLKELEELNLQANEFEQLMIEHKQLIHAEDLQRDVQVIKELLAGEAGWNILKFLTKAESLSQQLMAHDARALPIQQLLTESIITSREALSTTQHYESHIQLNPERLREIETRLEAIHRLARKHQVTADQLSEKQKSLEKKLLEWQNHSELQQTLTTHIAEIAKNYQALSLKLFKARQKIADGLAEAITKTLQKLDLKGSLFTVKLTHDINSDPKPYGQDHIQFLVTTNTGFEPQPLAQIVSGGELSRISLAIHSVSAEKSTYSTFIFDEVDVGVSGKTAAVIGQLLRQLATHHQVICITHQPQVAAHGHHHYEIKKLNEKESVKITMNPLQGSEKIAEIARLLGGIKTTTQTLLHAEELIKEAQEN